MSIATGPVIAIAIGGSVFILGFIVLAVWSLHRWKYGHSRSRQERAEEQTASKACARPIPYDLPFPQASIVTRANIVPAQRAYGALSPVNEYDHPAYRTRDSTTPFHLSDNQSDDGLRKLTKPPHRAARGDRGFAMRTLKASHLSAILESPTLSTKSSRARSKSRDTKRSSIASSKVSRSRSRSRKAKKRPKQSRKNSTSSPEHCSTSAPLSSQRVEPLLGRVRLPSFRQSVLTEGNIGILTERSNSEPSFLSAINEDDPFCSQSSLTAIRNAHHSRSTSLLKQEATSAPTAPVPPLPNEASSRSLTASNMQRPFSPVSMCSVDTCSSAILGTDLATPKLSAREDFSQRNHGMDLVPKLRQLEPDYVRDELVLGSRPPSRQDDLQTASVQLAKKASYEHSFLSVPAAAGQTYDSDSSHGRASRLSNRSGSSDRRRKGGAGPASTPALLKPKRRSVTKKTSATGSPVERKEKHSSILQSISGNAPPVREISGTSTQSSSSLEGTRSLSQQDLFKDQLSPKPSNIKGSPTSRGKHHKRSDTVRIQVEPIFYNPASRSNSNSKMGDIAEDEAMTQTTCTGLDGLGKVTIRPLTPSDAMQLPRSDSAPSLQASSPTLSPRACRRSSRQRQTRSRQDPSTSPQLRSTHASATSSILLKNFPDTPARAEQSGSKIDPTEHSTVPQLGRQYSEPVFVPQGLTLAKLTGESPRSTYLDGLSVSHTLSASPPRSSEEDAHAANGKPRLNNAAEHEQSTSRTARAPAPLRILSPTPKSPPTTGLSGIDSASPPPQVRLAPLSSSVNPMNTKPYLPPPYTSSPPIVLTQPSPLTSPVPPSRPRASPGQSVLSNIRELRRSQLIREHSSSNTIDGLDDTEATTPTKEQLRWMHMRDSSPTLSGRITSSHSPGPSLSMTPGRHQSSLFGGDEPPQRAVITKVTNKRYRAGRIWDEQPLTLWQEDNVKRADGTVTNFPRALARDGIAAQSSAQQGLSLSPTSFYGTSNSHFGL